MNQNYIPIPPVIASLFIDSFHTGSYDNPQALLDAIDSQFEEDDLDKFSEVEDLQGKGVEIFFSVLNSTDGTLECKQVTNKNIKSKESIKKIYDTIIEKYRADFEAELLFDDENEREVCF